jgi:superfamily II DNA/RNA helicase
MKQHQRNRTIDDLRRGRIRLLIATDVAARGIDISDITQVINFDLPKIAEDYLHRIGRTGRAGASGTAYSFFTRNDWKQVKAIENYIGKALTNHTIAGLEPTERPRGASAPGGYAKRPYRGGGQGAPGGRPGGFGGGPRRPDAERSGDRPHTEHRHADSRPSGEHRGGSDRPHGERGGFNPARRDRDRDRSTGGGRRGYSSAS